MIKTTKTDNPVFEDFEGANGLYSCPSVALIAFDDVLRAYGYSMEYTIADNTLHDSIIIDIFDSTEIVGFAHIAWCRFPSGRYSVIGRIVR